MHCGAYYRVLDSIFSMLEQQSQNEDLFLNSVSFDQFHEGKTCPKHHFRIILDSNDVVYVFLSAKK